MNTTTKIKNPCQNAPGYHKLCSCHGWKRLTREEIEAGNNEISRRLNYVINNREALGITCAEGNLHLAPGDDSVFPYKQAPWLEDGSVNPPGVWTDPENDRELSRKHSKTTKWKCTKCGALCESFEAREFNKNDSSKKQLEETWWWCMKCKDAKAKLLNSNKKQRKN